MVFFFSDPCVTLLKFRQFYLRNDEAVIYFAVYLLYVYLLSIHYKSEAYGVDTKIGHVVLFIAIQCKHLIIFVSSVNAVFMCFVNYVCCQDWPLIY